MEEDLIDFEAILGEKFDDGDNKPTTDASDNTDLAAQGNQPVKDKVETAKPDTANEQKPQGTQPQQTTGEEQEKSDPKDIKPWGTTGFFTNSKNDIVDKDGNLVARNGRERRLWNEARELKHQHDALQQGYAKLRAQIEEPNIIRDLQAKHGVNAQELGESIALVAQFKRDPAAVVRDLLARALAVGYTTEQILGPEHKDYINTQAMTKALDERFNKLQQGPQLTPEQENEQRARTEYNQFISAHEYAEVHADAIGKLAIGREITPERAYFELKLFAQQHQLDFTKPLGPQIEAKKSVTQEPGTQQQQQQTTVPTAPMINGGGASATPVTTQQPQNYDANEDWRTILRRELSANGMNV